MCKSLCTYVVHNVDSMANEEINDFKYIAKDIYLLNHTSLVYIHSFSLLGNMMKDYVK